MKHIVIAALFMALAVARAIAQDTADPLASWNDTPTKAGIVAFVRATTDADSPAFVPVPQRIATFDNDGTLWVEQPLYAQVAFALDRVRELAPKHSEWRNDEPFKTLLSGNQAALDQFSIQDFAAFAGAAQSGITESEFEAIAGKWLGTVRHPRFDRLYTELFYQPMLELMQYLRASGYKTYIVTGGGQDFVRVFGEPVYGVPPEQVIGSISRTKYTYAADGQPELVKLPEIMHVDDRGGKPAGINFMIGRRPVAAFGNSVGDQQMLEWTQAGAGKNPKAARLMMLVHHDDATREYAYGAKSKIGTFSDALMSEAKKRGWFVISMKNDWKRIFAFEK